MITRTCGESGRRDHNVLVDRSFRASYMGIYQAIVNKMPGGVVDYIPVRFLQAVFNPTSKEDLPPPQQAT